MNKKLFTAALSSVMALSLTGCGGSTAAASSPSASASSSSAASAASSDGKVIKFGLSGIEGVFDPMLYDTVYDQWVTQMIFEPLVTNDAEGNFIPYLATWELSDDKLTYTFTLKDGITFSDGTPLTAEDVAFTYSIPKDDDYAASRVNLASDIADIKVIDDKTVAFTMSTASPANIGDFKYGIMSKDYYKHDSFEELSALNDKPMGSGAFKLESYANKQYVNLVKNENYWDKDNAAKIDGFQFLEVSEDAVLTALQNGEIDMCQPAAKAENVEAIQNMNNAHLISYLGNGYTFMCFNTTHPTLSDVKVRQALMYALDRKSFLTAEYGSDELVSLGMAPISPVSWAYPGDNELNAYDYDLDKAASLLDEAGWKDTDGDGIRDKDGTPLELHWLVYTDSTWPGTLSSMAYDSWGQIGVKLDIDLYDFNTVSSMVFDPAPGEKNFDIFTMGWSLNIDPDPSGELFDADAYTAGGYCASGFRDDRSQELIAEGKAEFDQDKRAAIYKEWAIRQNELVPTAVVAYRSEIWGISNKVHGLDDISSFVDFTYLINDATID